MTNQIGSLISYICSSVKCLSGVHYLTLTIIVKDEDLCSSLSNGDKVISACDIHTEKLGVFINFVIYNSDENVEVESSSDGNCL